MRLLICSDGVTDPLGFADRAGGAAGAEPRGGGRGAARRGRLPRARATTRRRSSSTWVLNEKRKEPEADEDLPQPGLRNQDRATKRGSARSAATRRPLRTGRRQGVPPSLSAADDDGDPFRTCTLIGLRPSDGTPVAPRGDEVILLGRDSSSPICALCGDNVSTAHASIRLAGVGLMITDLGSSNGTFVNEVRLDVGRERPLLPGDRVTLATDPPLTLNVAELDLPEGPR